MTKDGSFSAQETGLIFDLADTDGNGKDVKKVFVGFRGLFKNRLCLSFIHLNEYKYDWNY
jgi:hypothetical protein